MPDRFVWKDMRYAQAECSHRNEQVKAPCPSCKMPVMLHCASCRIQVTGCLCSEVERFGNDETWRRAVERYGEEMARDQYRRAGLFVPEVKTQFGDL